jgi:ATP/maltotriose-dependent transcriptional regulator MalT
MYLTRRGFDLDASQATVSPTAADVPPGRGLHGRHTECHVLDRLIADVRAGQSRVLILRGEAGAGKSALLEYLAGQASGSGCRVERAVGVPSEMELAFAGLHQLCAPMLARAERLPEPQRDALKQLTEIAQAYGNDSALGLEARCRALLSDGTDADDLYREAIDRLGRTRLRPELARAHLLYGEWLRREGRRLDACEQLRTAHDLLTAIGMAAFAERARQELLATGERLRKRSVETVTTLTAQEAHIARLARDGSTNTEIGQQLYLSARTVEWHLRKVFTKLGISSRRELRAALTQAA